MPSTAASARSFGTALALATALCVAIAIWLFPKAQPTIALKQDLTRDSAIERATVFATSRGLPIAGSRVAVRFAQDVEAQTYLELEAGGKAAVNAEVNRGDVALFFWTVRFFRSGDPREVRVTLAPDGTVIGFSRRLAQDDLRPALDSARAMALADSLRVSWLGLSARDWRPVASSSETVQPSGRLDRTITWERTDRRVGDAPLRLDIVIRGDQAGGAQRYLKVPEPFLRRYAERRADNDLYALIASAWVPLFALVGVAALVGARKRGLIRWRPAVLAGSVLGLALGLAQLNEIPGSYFQYDTALTPGTFLAQQWLIAVVGGVGMALVSTVLLAAGELLTREAFPHHYDWWKMGQYAGTRPIAWRLLGGYTLAAFGLAYVSVFYLLAERGFGWWSPSSLLDDPNQISTPLPWLSAVATSLQAGVLEEVLFRAIPLAFVARAVRDKPWKAQAMAVAVVVTALVFGFAHANYPSFPAYARGVELFAEAVLWAVLYLRVGLVTTIVGHFTYDLILFGLFAGAGDAPAYRITLAVIVVVAAIPALLVTRKAWGVRRLRDDAPDEARFAAWVPAPTPVTAEHPVQTVAPTAKAGRWTTVTAALAVAAGLWPTNPVSEPRFSASRAQVSATADSLLQTLGATPAGWTRLMAARPDGWGLEQRFLVEHDTASVLASRLAREWLHAGTWDVRYVHTDGSVAERNEAWSIQLGADGRPHTWRHELADSAPAPTAPRAIAEQAARSALIAWGASPTALVLLSATETARPARLDVEFEFIDSSITLPASASLRRVATVSGDRVTRIGHRIFLPESWRRADAARSSARGTVIFGGVILLVLPALFALVRFMRRPPLMPALAWPARRTMIGVVAATGVAMALLGANAWPVTMHGWDTASPFNRHQWTSVVVLLGAVLGPAAVWGLWLAADAVRRRLGVPVRAPSARNAWLVGTALALGPVLPSLVPALVFPALPTSVDTTADLLVPMIGRLTGATTDALISVPFYVFMVGALAFVRAPLARVAWLIMATLVGSAAATLPGAPALSDWFPRIGVQVVGVMLAIVVIWRLGRSSMEAWIIGALVSSALAAVASAMRSASGGDRVAHVLGAVVALGVAGIVASRRRGGADDRHGEPTGPAMASR